MAMTSLLSSRLLRISPVFMVMSPWSTSVLSTVLPLRLTPFKTGFSSTWYVTTTPSGTFSKLG